MYKFEEPFFKELVQKDQKIKFLPWKYNRKNRYCLVDILEKNLLDKKKSPAELCGRKQAFVILDDTQADLELEGNRNIDIGTCLANHYNCTLFICEYTSLWHTLCHTHPHI